MADLTLKGPLNLIGPLELQPDGGTLLVGEEGLKALVQGAETKGPPVLLPPAPKPIDDGPAVTVIRSFNSTVTTNGKAVVAMGFTMQGTAPTWPGMVLRRAASPWPTINSIPINVERDTAQTFGAGGTATFNESGQ